MAKFWKSADFQTLNKKWKKKLKNSGFVDAEKTVGGLPTLKSLTTTQGREGGIFRYCKDPTVREAKMEYFRLLSQAFSDETNFDDSSDRLIMERTVEGKKIREISRELRSRGMRKFNRDTIRYVRRRYETRWGIRNWKPEETVSRRIRIR